MIAENERSSGVGRCGGRDGHEEELGEQEDEVEKWWGLRALR